MNTVCCVCVCDACVRAKGEGLQPFIYGEGPDLWQTGLAVSTALLSIICNSLSKEWCKLSGEKMSVLTSIGSEKVKTEKVNVCADLW